MKFVPFALVLFTSGLLSAEAPSAPVVADQSTPRGAVKAYALAIQDADPKKLKDLLYTANPTEEKLVEAMQRTAVAAGHLRTVIESKFGPGSSLKLAMEQPTPEDIAKVDRAVEKVDGDNAMVTMTDAPGQSVDMKLIKVDGKWKVAVAPLLPPIGEGAAKEAVRSMNNFAAALEATVKDTEAGKFVNVDEANGAIQARKLADMLPPTTHPITRPTTIPAGK